MAITPFSAVPSRATGQDTFSADVETFWGQLPTFVNEVNAFGAGLSSQITTSSTTSLLVGTGSKTLTVGTVLGFQIGYPVRIAYSDSIHMTGTVTSYNPTTGELICNITSSTGSGTYAVWAVYAIPASITNVPDGDKGDITVSGTGSTWTIDDNVVTPAKLTAGAKTDRLASITATQASGALTFTVNPCVLDFRSTTLSSGVPQTVSLNTAVSLVLPSLGTLGFPTTVAGRIIVLLMANGEPAIVSLAGGNSLDETGLINTTAISASSTANNVFYSTTARTNQPYRVVGAVDVVNTAGAWGNPTLVQPYGGNALASMSSLGYGQTWQDVTGSRSGGTTYYNTTGKPILVIIRSTQTTGNTALVFLVNGVEVSAAQGAAATSCILNMSVIVPSGSSYSVTVTIGSIGKWSELR